MKKTRILSLLLAVTMVFAVLPFTVGAEGEKATYDFTGVFSGATCGNGAISFAYGVADTAAALAADPSKLIPLTQITNEPDGDGNYTSPNGGTLIGQMCKSTDPSDIYAHFIKRSDNNFVCLLPQKGVQNAIVFTAPVNGDYTFNSQIWNGWGATDTDFEVYAKGKLVKKQTINSGNNNTTFASDEAIYLNAGENMYFFFVHPSNGHSYIRFTSFAVSGTGISRVVTSNYGFTTNFIAGPNYGNGPISFAYGVANTAAELAADPSKLIPLTQITNEPDGDGNYTSPNGSTLKGQMWKSTDPSDIYAHFIERSDNHYTCLLPQKGIQNAIVFTAPANGDYTFTSQIYNGWGATDTDFEVYARGKLVKKQTINSGNNDTTFASDEAIYLMEGEKLYFFFVHPTNGNSYIRFTSFTVTGAENIFAPTTAEEGAKNGIDGGYYTDGSGEIVSYTLAFTSKFAEFDTIKDSITSSSYGMFIYREGNINGKVSTNTPEALTEYFYTVIDGITEANKDTNIYVVPYVVIGGTTYCGSAMIACASDFAGNWLGNAE